MKKYPLGHAVIEWKSGGYSEACIFQDGGGRQQVVCGNWLSPAMLWSIEKDIENVITDADDIYMFLTGGDCC